MSPKTSILQYHERSDLHPQNWTAIIEFKHLTFSTHKNITGQFQLHSSPQAGEIFCISIVSLSLKNKIASSLDKLRCFETDHE